MKKSIRLSRQTRANWLVDLSVFSGAVIAMLTGIYFLFIPSGGYDGGRNSFYNVTVLFGRESWEDLHLWGGLAMILAVVIHLTLHWRWVVGMIKRVAHSIRTGESTFSRGAKVNIAINLTIALSFLVTAISGLYFLLLTDDGYQGGRNPNWDPGFLFSRFTWDMLHTWGAVVLTLAAMAHFYIHWGWIRKVTARFFRSLLPQNRRQPARQTVGIR